MRFVLGGAPLSPRETLATQEFLHFVGMQAGTPAVHLWCLTCRTTSDAEVEQEVRSEETRFLSYDGGRSRSGRNPAPPFPRHRGTWASRAAEHPVGQLRGYQPGPGLLRGRPRGHAHPRQARRRRCPVRQRLFPRARLRASPLGHHHSDVSDDHRHPPHALPGRPAS